MAKRKRNLGKNPYNEDNKLFKSLTRLFSSPLTQRNTQTGRQLRRRNILADLRAHPVYSLKNQNITR